MLFAFLIELFLVRNVFVPIGVIGTLISDCFGCVFFNDQYFSF